MVYNLYASIMGLNTNLSKIYYDLDDLLLRSFYILSNSCKYVRTTVSFVPALLR